MRRFRGLKCRLIWSVFFASFMSLQLVAEEGFRLAKIFTDNMVLQQGKSVPVWGFASEGDRVKVTCNGATATTVAKGGKWKVELPAMDYGKGYQLVVKGSSDSITLKNVAVGEVWIASGQSNMDFSLSRANDAKAEISKANFPELRIFKAWVNREAQPKSYDLGKTDGWSECSPRTVTGFSAVGYYFGRELLNRKNVTIGIIQSAVGGTKAELWISEENCPPFKVRKAKKGPSKGPGFHYNAMIHPLVSYACKGFLWYQGESNAGDKEKYEKTLTALIKDWRGQWKEELPFLIVQLANFGAHSNSSVDGPWARLREAQFKTLKLPATGMAVTIDVGDSKDIHPKNKRDVGYRLALVAEHVAYGDRKIVYSGPLYKEMKVNGGKVELFFDHVGGGLVAKGGNLKGFYVAGSNNMFEEANAVIKNDRVVVWNESVSSPVHVRYAFANDPVNNLINKEGLPAVPFRTDAL